MPKFSAYMKGGDGSVGPPGASIIDGVLANEGMLPVPNQDKYAFLVGTSDPKHLWVWNDQKEGENKWEDQGTTASEIGRVTASASTVAWNVPPSVNTQFSTSNQIDYFNFDFNIPMGRSAGFGDFTATISATSWDAEPAISTSTDGEDWEKNIHYDFTLPVGRPAGFGEISVTTQSLSSGTPPWVAVSTDEESPEWAKKFNFEFAIPEGVAAGFSTTQHVSVSTLDTGQDAVVEITTVTSSPETAKEFNFHFGLPRGDALAIYDGIPFTTEDGFYYHWDTTNTTTLVFDRGTVEKLPIYIYNSDNESIAATFKLSASTIEYEADEKFNGTMYLAMPATLQNIEIGTVSSTTYGYEPVVSKSTGSTSTNIILDFVIPEGYPGHTTIDSMTTNIQSLFTEVNSITTNINSLSTTVDTKAPINNPEFTGNPTAPTQAVSDNSTKLATTAYVKAVVAKKALHLSVSSFNSFPKDISNSNITTTMRVVNIEWGTPSSITSKVGWNTNTAGHLVLSGTITSTGTTAEIDLIDFG